ncbi:MAG: helicase-exonuclease AddAB subunit AddA [Eubacteriales bacterium]|nr:helicase-exonuclease AddAB subunit AddA [Eubacteriales bacterium]
MGFTPEQESAIHAKNKELLVSAAAGSGKTAVLVERILYMISHWGLSIDRMLIVTYTRAAAAELRERLENRIVDAAQEDDRLLKQAELVGSAQISTIHAYCQRVIREHFKDCNIDPQFSIGDERTLQTMYQESMEDTLDRIYTDAKTDPAIGAFLKKMTEKQIAAVLDMTFRFLISRPNPLQWFEEQTEKQWMVEAFDQEPIAEVFVSEGVLMLEAVLAEWAKTKRLAEEPAFAQPLLKTIEGDLETLNNLSDGVRNGFSAMLKAVTECKFVTLARTKPITEDEIALVEAYKELRNGYKKRIQSFKELLPIRLDTALQDMNQISTATAGLGKAMKILFDTFQGRKLEQAVLDFNDLEHMTLAVLKDSRLQQLEANRFDAVFVDEYQDVSAIQEAILNGLKRESDEEHPQYYFYVGDVKQSIYRFRLAEPKLFLSKQESFSEEENATHRKIILNRNFRSREGVLDAVNRTFAHVMDKRVTEIDYDRNARLYPGIPSREDPFCELRVFSSADRKPTEVVLQEAEEIAQDILATVGTEIRDRDGQAVGVLHFRDIAILTPVVKNVADKVEMVLTKAGIPVYTDAGANALGGEESIQAIQHLLLMDNQRNDLALIAELRSPLFQMNESDLSQIRLQLPQKEASFYEALQKTSKMEPPDELAKRCKAVLQMLDEERFLYRNLPPEEYLWDFLMRSGLYAHYGTQPGGKLRQANLRMLCQKAGEYVQTHRDGLQGFLECIQKGVGGDSSSPTVVNPWEDVVRILTIHKSKGLEFPTVYLMGLGGSIAKRRQTKIISMHSELGIGLMYINEHSRTKRTTLMQSGIQLRLASEERAEKARLLYVAMTRPKNRLVMIGSTKQKKPALESTVENACLKVNEINDLTGVQSAGSLLDWLLQCITPQDSIQWNEENHVSTNLIWKKESGKSFPANPTSFPHKNAVWRVFFHIDKEKSISSSAVEVDNQKKAIFDLPLTDGWKENTNADQEDSFSNDPLSPLPAYQHLPLKLGVTALCRAIREKQPVSSEAEEIETITMKRMPLLTQRPKLLSSLPTAPAFLDAPLENRAAIRGTVTHQVISSIDLVDRLQNIESGIPYIKEEIERMTRQGMLTEEEETLIDADAIGSFFASSIGQRLLKATVVHREWSFNVAIEEPIRTIAQGVIDCCFLENNHWILIDFKTDHINNEKELWDLYADQIAFYKLALEKVTGLQVGEMGFYSLSLKTMMMKRLE